MKKFCITGGIACGKSVVASCLAADGWYVVDTDVIAREQLEPDAEGYKKIVDSFGENILNEQHLVDRTLLGRIVFSDAEKRKVLNSILHPLIRSITEQRLSEHAREHPETPAVTVIPLLHETGGEERFDSIVCVASSMILQTTRLRQRGLNEEEAVQRIRSQWPVEEKIKHSHIVLWNNGSMALLNRQLELLKQLWLSS